MATAPKPTTAKKESSCSSIFASLTMVFCIVIGVLLWKFVMGSPSNFEGGNPEGHPLPGNYFAMVYKGGFIVPILIGMLLMVIVFSMNGSLLLVKQLVLET
jgi:biopolymer transport protein ExbB